MLFWLIGFVAESDSGYSGSPSPETTLPPPPPYAVATKRTTTIMSALTHSISEEYVPNVPYFISEYNNTSQDLMFGPVSSRLNASDSNHHINYLPPVWGQLHHIKDEISHGTGYDDDCSQDYEPQVHLLTIHLSFILLLSDDISHSCKTSWDQ